MLKKLNIQTFNSNNSILINIVGTLYLMIRNLDFVFMIDHVFKTQILQSSYYKNNFQYKNAFQGPGFSGPRFFRVQVFMAPGPGSGSRFQKQPDATQFLPKSDLRQYVNAFKARSQTSVNKHNPSCGASFIAFLLQLVRPIVFFN